ncbi:MAG: TIGR03067 domain-containing protein [Pirellulales bacterium]|nr:TIGR03067 domain-containing protein [Pirellulales bacterium]
MRSFPIRLLVMILLAAIAALTVAGLQADNGGREDIDGDLIRMQGKWKLVKFVYYRNGVEDPVAPEQANGTRTVTGNRYHLKLSILLTTVDDDYSFTLIPGQSPKGEDVVLPAPDKRVIKGIYEIDGDTLRRSYSQPGTPRPKTFRGGNQTYQEWRRMVELPEKAES